jgi:SOS-response transcriptional repressor LexA
MQDVSEKIQRLARMMDLGKLSYRDIGKRIAAPGDKAVHPQIVKNAMAKLQLESALYSPTTTTTTTITQLISIPVLGIANAGPATHIAGGAEQGTIQVSASLLPSSNYKDFYALEVDGESMNEATVRGNRIENGSYVIIDGSKKTPVEGEVVTVVYDGLANIKKVHFDYESEQIILYSQSTENFQPIYISPNDNWEGLVGGSVIQVVKKPVLGS